MLQSVLVSYIDISWVDNPYKASSYDVFADSAVKNMVTNLEIYYLSPSTAVFTS
jgi:hypothetical protein